VAARTAAPDAPATTPVSPARDPDGPPSPVLAWPAEWPVPQLPEQPRQTRGRNGRGLPMAPTLAAAGNATSLLATGAYAAGGVVGVAATGVVAAAGATAAVVRRRKTVRRNLAARTSNRSGGGSPRSGGMFSPSGGGSLSAGGRRSGGRTDGGKSGSGGSASRQNGRSGGAMFGPPGRSPGGLGGGAGKSLTPGSGGAGGGSHSPKLPKQKREKKDHKKKSNHGLSAAVGRTVRSAAKPGSTPRKALAAMGHGGLVATKATGRGIRKAATADATKKAAKATRAGARKLRGAAVDGVRSVLAAAWTGLRKRSGRAALTRLRETWARRRKDRADKEAAKTKAADKATPPTVAASVRRPTTTITPATATASTGGTTMPGHHFVAPAMEAARIAANYDPQGMLQVGEDFAGLEEALRLYAEAMKITVENADAKQPLDPRIVEIMRGIHSLQLKAAEMATELRPAFESLHQVDLDRLRNPRKGAAGERKWDVTTNLGNH
jgi:hypothetical protein